MGEKKCNRSVSCLPKKNNKVSLPLPAFFLLRFDAINKVCLKTEKPYFQFFNFLVEKFEHLILTLLCACHSYILSVRISSEQGNVIVWKFSA
jgi:hypothetical protein